MIYSTAVIAAATQSAMPAMRTLVNWIYESLLLSKKHPKPATRKAKAIRLSPNWPKAVRAVNDGLSFCDTTVHGDHLPLLVDLNVLEVRSRHKELEGQFFRYGICLPLIGNRIVRSGIWDAHELSAVSGSYLVHDGKDTASLVRVNKTTAQEALK